MTKPKWVMHSWFIRVGGCVLLHYNKGPQTQCLEVAPINYLIVSVGQESMYSLAVFFLFVCFIF